MNNPLAKIAEAPERFAVYASQAMLRSFDDDSVTLWLDGDYDNNPFAGKVAPEHPTNGTRYLIFAVEIDDDESPIDVDMRARFLAAADTIFKPATKAEKVVQRAALLCKAHDFHRFVHYKISHLTDEQKNAFILTGIPRWLTDLGLRSFSEPQHAEEWCKYYLYYRCNVTSRRQLGFKVKAREAFDAVRREHEAWGRGRR